MKRILIIIMLSTLTIACEKQNTNNEESQVSTNIGKDNYTDIAVTGGQNYISYSCAELIGYTNIGVLSLTGVEIGIILSDKENPDENNGRKFITRSLEDERKFTISISKEDGYTLKPNTKYYYRTYVKSGELHMLGNIESFTTLKVPSTITEAVNAYDIDYNHATIKCIFEENKFHPKDNYSIGIEIYNSDRTKTDGADCTENYQNGEYTHTFKVCASTTYNYNSYIYVSGEYFGSEVIKTFTTLNGDDLIQLINVNDIEHTEAKTEVAVNTNKLTEEFDVIVYFSPREYDEEIGVSGNDITFWHSNEEGRLENFSLKGAELDFGTKYYTWASLYYEDKYVYTTKTLSFNTLDIENIKYVDMGTSVKWSNCNLGASSCVDIGNYYAWGETTPRNESNYDRAYKWTYDKYKGYEKYNLRDKKDILDLEDDAAYVNLGDKWRIPSIDDWDELEEKTSCIQTGKNGIRGFIFKSNINGNVIFFPYTGYKVYNTFGFSTYGEDETYYLTSQPSEDSQFYFFSCKSYSTGIGWRMSRSVDFMPIRPVYDINL